MLISRNAIPTAATNTRVVAMSKVAAPGWIINKVPKKPMKIAKPRRLPTRSLRNKAAAAVTINGTVPEKGTKVEDGDQVKVVHIDNSIDLIPLQIGLVSAGGGLLAIGTTWTLTLVRRDYQIITDVRMDPRNTTREEADAYTQQFQQSQKQANRQTSQPRSKLIIKSRYSSNLTLAHTHNLNPAGIQPRSEFQISNRRIK